MTKKELNNGTIFDFKGENNLMYVYSHDRFGYRSYVVNFNAKVISVTKTYKACEKKVKSLIAKYEMAMIPTENVQSVPVVNENHC